MKKMKLGYVEPEKKLQTVKIKDSEATKSTFTKSFAEKIGDLEVDEESYLSLLECIKSKKIYDSESIIYLLGFIRDFPQVTEYGIDGITTIFVKDIFKDKEITEQLSLLKDQGVDDYSYAKLLLELERRYLHHIKCLKLDLDEVDSLLSEYPTRYVSDIKDYMKSQKVLLDKIVPYIPGKELIEKDIKHQSELARYYRIDFGIGALGSISALKTAVCEGESIEKTTLDTMDWCYHIHFDSFEKDIPLSFTKEEYLDSVKKEQLYKRWAEMVLLTYMASVSEQVDEKPKTYKK